MGSLVPVSFTRLSYIISGFYLFVKCVFFLFFFFEKQKLSKSAVKSNLVLLD